MDNVLVTGASRGLGLAIVELLANRGYVVLAAARSETEELQRLVRRTAESGGGEVRFLRLDLADIDAIPKAVAAARELNGPIFGLVNNAAISAEGLLPTLRNSDIEAVLRVNVLAPLILSKYVVRGMMADGRGRIVNVSSIVASTGFKALSVYAASKSAMTGFTKSLAREVGSLGITVNAVAPGFLKTRMTSSMDEAARSRIARRSALRRLAELEDVAEAVAYLLSDKARNVTGTVMTVDAGSTA